MEPGPSSFQQSALLLVVDSLAGLLRAVAARRSRDHSHGLAILAERADFLRSPGDSAIRTVKRARGFDDQRSAIPMGLALALAALRRVRALAAVEIVHGRDRLIVELRLDRELAGRLGNHSGSRGHTATAHAAASTTPPAAATTAAAPTHGVALLHVDLPGTAEISLALGQDRLDGHTAQHCGHGQHTYGHTLSGCGVNTAEIRLRARTRWPALPSRGRWP